VRSKFGLFISEVIEALDYLRRNGMGDCLNLLHFHLGSQINNIRNIKHAIIELVRVYVEMQRLGAGLKFIDVGGGLGVDYDGSQTNFASSMNYTTQEYANDIVFSLQEICDAAQVPHPTIVSESGRAIVAHHSMLVIDILGVGEFDVGKAPEQVPATASRTVQNLFETHRDISRKNVLEAYHDALEYKDQALQLFNLGNLSLSERVVAEDIFWAICQKIRKIVRELRDVPEDLEGLERALSDTYFCNFSMFQSLPDIWAIDQLFPIMPIHRLGEEPTRRAVLADITCDSDGKIDHFIDRRDVKQVLELHPVNGQDYFLGVFLIGAYQEILGDLHNLFGNTNTVHVSLANGGGTFNQNAVVDNGFLQLVDLGILPANDPRVANTIAVTANPNANESAGSLAELLPNGLDFFRYNHDGYGEPASGGNWTGAGVGRLWPILDGEYGQYQYLLGRKVAPYVADLQHYTSPAGLLSEQVWDNAPPAGNTPGTATLSMDALNWSLSMYIQLIAASFNQQHNIAGLPGMATAVFNHYAGAAKPAVTTSVSPPVTRQPVTVRYAGSLAASATAITLHWGHDGWQNVTDTPLTKQADGSWTAGITVPAGTGLNTAFVNQAERGAYIARPRALPQLNAQRTARIPVHAIRRKCIADRVRHIRVVHAQITTVGQGFNNRVLNEHAFDPDRIQKGYAPPGSADCRCGRGCIKKT